MKILFSQLYWPLFALIFGRRFEVVALTTSLNCQTIIEVLPYSWSTKHFENHMLFLIVTLQFKNAIEEKALQIFGSPKNPPTTVGTSDYRSITIMFNKWCQIWVKQDNKSHKIQKFLYKNWNGYKCQKMCCNGRIKSLMFSFHMQFCNVYFHFNCYNPQYCRLTVDSSYSIFGCV